jgi:hypothetical protein
VTPANGGSDDHSRHFSERVLTSPQGRTSGFPTKTRKRPADQAIRHRALAPHEETNLVSDAIMYDATTTSMLASPIAVDAECPDCGAVLLASLQIVVERDVDASQRPVTPELLVVCHGCWQLLVLALRPSLQERSTL